MLTTKQLVRILKDVFPEERILYKEVDLVSYSYDASFYTLKPLAVVRPVSVEEVQGLLRIANRYKVPVTFRAAGTSLSGQALGEGIVADLSFAWKNYEILEEGKKIRFEPGIIGSHLNLFLKPYHRKIGPDPASINACMMGGILSNNASGMCCGVENNSYHTLTNMKAVLYNGYILDTGDPLCEEKLKTGMPDVYRGILQLKDRIESSPELVAKIRKKYSIKNTVGYSLNAFLDFDSVSSILAHLMIGAEGTLGFIAEAELRTLPDPRGKYTGLLCFPDIFKACEAIPHLKERNAAAVELMDRSAIRSLENKEGIPEYLRQLPEEATVLLVEFEYSTEEEYMLLKEKVLPDLQNKLSLLLPADFTGEEEKRNMLWNVRKGLFPSVGASRKTGTTVIIEDIAFSLEHLPYATLDLQNLFRKHNYDNAIIFGHAKDGNLHFVITQKFETSRDIRQYDAFMRDVVSLVVDKYNGSLKAEHGTGRNMAPFVEKEWGKDLYAIMKEIKSLLDPNGILNPGVIINEDPEIHVRNLKVLPSFQPAKREMTDHFAAMSLELAEKCIECGFCESVCPSKDITSTPRKRILLFRESLRSKDFYRKNKKDFTYYVLDTCVTCGLCEEPCPVGINTGNLVKTLKARKHTRLKKALANLSVIYFQKIESLLRFQLFFSGILKKYFRKSVSLLETSTRILNRVVRLPVYFRELPEPSLYPHLRKAYRKTEQSKPDFYYFPTCLSRVFGNPLNGEDLSELVPKIAEKLSLRVEVLDTTGLCCSQPFGSKGYFDAQEEMIKKTKKLLDTLPPDVPVIVDNLSCSYVLKTKSQYQNYKFLDSVEWTELLIKQFPDRFVKSEKKVYIQNICSSRKLGYSKKLVEIIRHFTPNVEVATAPECCGFAGDKGVFFPEITDSATEKIRKRLEDSQYDFYISGNLTCELGLQRGTQKPFSHILYFVYKNIK